MSKFDLLVDGTTIINFPFIMKLFKRYSKSASVLILIILSICVSVFFYQESFYYTSISFSSQVDDKDPRSNILSLIENKASVRSTDILNLKSSVDFNRKISQELVQSEFFYKLRFDLGMFGHRKIGSNELNKKCSFDKDCLIGEISKLIPKFYEITDKDRTGVNFVIEVKALNELTSNVILNSIVKSISETRTEFIQSKLKEEEKRSLNILIQKKNEFSVEDYYRSIEEKDRLENELKEIQTKIDHQINVMSIAQDNLAVAESNYEHSKKIANRKVDYDEIDKESRRKDLREKVEKLNNDIAALENSSINQTEKDIEIISQLKKEYVEAKSRLRKLGDGNSSTNLSVFVKQNDEKFRSKEIEYKIVKDQLETAKKNYDDLNLKKKDVLNNKIKLEQNIDILKPSVDFIKSLEQKIEQLKLSATTVMPDIRFDRYSAPPEPMRKVGIILIIGYFIILTNVLLVIYLSLRYLLDNRIYDENDLKIISPDLNVIGNGPLYK